MLWILKIIGAFFAFILGIFWMAVGFSDLGTNTLGGIFEILSGLVCTPIYTVIVKKITDMSDLKRNLIRAVIFIVLLGIGVNLAPSEDMDYTSDKENTQIEEEIQPEQDIEKDEAVKPEPDNSEKDAYIKSTKEYDYKDIIENTEDYTGKKAMFSGKVYDIRDGEEEGSIVIIMWLDEYEDTLSDGMVAVYLSKEDEEKNSEVSRNLVEEDKITVYGELGNVLTMRPAIKKRDVPLMYARYIDIK